ncbi:17109_t:CDS:2 [Dentiscutata heterogama]|uniref:17109_t:CDS:1 n=1 Tax=Dentiscutata heterogama TaxID=1316150 RepID=A0ACA9KSF9_9GLOM|nr:17109_t:CDS:2 [Dentiscutata heterogama]
MGYNQCHGYFCPIITINPSHASQLENVVKNKTAHIRKLNLFIIATALSIIVKAQNVLHLDVEAAERQYTFPSGWEVHDLSQFKLTQVDSS